ncbi:hypothetical protein [Rhizobium etli]|uniref:hypothetical protein n=1 Tax=Rhizobium etli TaxID=29449 RepID=UPI001FDA10E5|nr:hypothetical protein [Rhizobium sp. IE4771]
MKKALRRQYPHIKSSHLDEAIAASFGFNSYAAMRPTLNQVSAHARLVVVIDHLLMLFRLEGLDIGASPGRRCIASSGASNSPMTDTTAQ